MISVPKEAKNPQHNYKYASSDSILEAGRGCLSKRGLALIPLVSGLRAYDGPDDRSGQTPTYYLEQTYRLVHAGGASIDLPLVPWPVIPERGRPLDKALASALTTSLAYFLRNLLLMDRVNEDDNMDARREPERGRREERRPEAATNGTTQTAPLDEFRAAAWTRYKAAGGKADDREAFKAFAVAVAKGKVLKDLSADEIGEATRWVRAAPEDDVLFLLRPKVEAPKASEPTPAQSPQEPTRAPDPPAATIPAPQAAPPTHPAAEPAPKASEPPISEEPKQPASVPLSVLQNELSQRVKTCGIAVKAEQKSKIFKHFSGGRKMSELSEADAGRIYAALRACSDADFAAVIQSIVGGAA